MNRFVRNNLFLIIACAVACVAAVVLLVFSVIRYSEMAKCIAEIEQFRQQIIELGKKKPAPVDENKPLIKQDIRLYGKLADELEGYFKSGNRAVAERFVSILNDGLGKKDEKLTPEKFVQDFREIWDKAPTEAERNLQFTTFKNRFPNWNSAVAAVMPEFQKLTTEPLDEDATVELVFSALGVPRTMRENPENMLKFIKKYQAELVKMMSNIAFDTSKTRVDWFGFETEPTTASSITQKYKNPQSHYPALAKVWDIYGDVVKRLVSCRKTIKDEKGNVMPWSREAENRLNREKVKFTIQGDKIDTFAGIFLRAAIAPDANAENAANAILGDEKGSLQVYRLRLQVSASLTGIRLLVKALEDAYKEHRIYIIRSVALFAVRDGADEIFRKIAGEYNTSTEENAGDKNEPAVQESRGRGRGRGRGGRGAEPQVPQPQQPKKQAAVKPAQEESNKKYEYYERIGYGDVLIGDDKTCTAIIDFDYVVKK